MATKTLPAPVEPDPVRTAYLEHLAGLVHGITHRFEIRAAARAAGETVTAAGDPTPVPTWAQWQTEHSQEAA